MGVVTEAAQQTGNIVATDMPEGGQSRDFQLRAQGRGLLSQSEEFPLDQQITDRPGKDRALRRRQGQKGEGFEGLFEEQRLSAGPTVDKALQHAQQLAVDAAMPAENGKGPLAHFDTLVLEEREEQGDGLGGRQGGQTLNRLTADIGFAMLEGAAQQVHRLHRRWGGPVQDQEGIAQIKPAVAPRQYRQHRRHDDRAETLQTFEDSAVLRIEEFGQNGAAEGTESGQQIEEGSLLILAPGETLPHRCQGRSDQLFIRG